MKIFLMIIDILFCFAFVVMFLDRIENKNYEGAIGAVILLVLFLMNYFYIYGIK